MGNKLGVRHYFAEGLTMRGYISLLPIMLPNWKRTYVLLGGPGIGKSTLIKVIGLELLDRGYEVDFLRSARDPDSINGFILKDAAFAMLDALEVSPLRWRAPEVIEKFINAGVFCDVNKLQKQSIEILKIEQTLKEIQLSLEEELAGVLDRPFSKALNQVSKENDIIKSLRSWNLKKEDSGPWPLAQHALQQLQKSVVNPCFLHALSANGWINLAPHFLTGRDQIRLEGEDTSDALNWVLTEAQQLGQVIEIVLHPLNPDEVIGIVFPERNLAIWQGNPGNLHDQQITLPNEKQLKETLQDWQKQRTKLKKIYMESVDFSKMDKLREELLNQILSDLESQNKY